MQGARDWRRLSQVRKRDRSLRLQIEIEHFRHDLSVALRRMKHAVDSVEPDGTTAHWQTAVVKVARWFMAPRGLLFDPWQYVQHDEKGIIQQMLDERSELMTRKVNGDLLVECLLVDEETLEIIPAQLEPVEAVFKTRTGEYIHVPQRQLNSVSKLPCTSLGIAHIRLEAGVNNEVQVVISRIRDRVATDKDVVE